MSGPEASSLFDAQGRRKYLNAAERARFVAAAKTFSPPIEVLCLPPHYTGCRISEAMALRGEHIDYGQRAVILPTLKQRKRGVFRMTPLPERFLEKLSKFSKADAALLFTWRRSTAWEKIAAVMKKAGICGPHACPRGVRHGFGVAAVTSGAPLTLVQRWLGHARLETTSIYLAVTGPEERRFARRMWGEDVSTQPTQGEFYEQRQIRSLPCDRE